MIVYKNIYEEDERLFSTGNEELDALLEETYYSGISDGYNYAQKEFGVIQDIQHSGMKRTYKKWVGRSRKKLAEKISNQNKKLIESNQINLYKFQQLSDAEAKDPKLLIKTLKDAKREIPDLRIVSNKNIFGQEIGDYNFTKEAVKEGTKQVDSKRLKNAAKKGEDVVTLLHNTHPVLAGHEIGHVEGRRMKGLGGRLARRGSSPKVRQEFNAALNQLAAEDGLTRAYKGVVPKGKISQTVNEEIKKAMKENNLPYQNKTGLKAIVKQYIDGKSLLADEKIASKKAINRMKKMVKRGDATKDQIKSGKKLLDAAYSTYAPVHKLPWRTTLENTIQIPSRRRK